MQDEKLLAAEETVEPFLQKMHKVIGKESDTQANRNWTFVEVFTAKNSCFLSRKICSRIKKSKGSFKRAGLYKCYWNSQTKTRSICRDKEDEGEDEKLVSSAVARGGARGARAPPPVFFLKSKNRPV